MQRNSWQLLSATPKYDQTLRISLDYWVDGSSIHYISNKIPYNLDSRHITRLQFVVTFSTRMQAITLCHPAARLDQSVPNLEQLVNWHRSYVATAHSFCYPTTLKPYITCHTSSSFKYTRHFN